MPNPRDTCSGSHRSRRFSWPKLIRACVPLALVAALSLLSACNMPLGSAATQQPIDVIKTSAAATLYAQYTEISRPPAGGISMTPTPVTPGTATPGLPVGPTSGTPQQATPAGSCNQAKFLGDVTIPDNTSFAPGTPFTKTWKLQNSGTCPWTAGYALVFTGGEKMGGPDSLPFTTAVVNPGDKVNVSVNLVAPASSGQYRGDWKLRSDKNEVFGVGKDAKPFWVQVRTVTAAGFDFVGQAGAASYLSGAGSETPTNLSFGGPENNPNGTAMVKDNVLLETGLTSGKLLFMQPKAVENGYVAGVFQPYTVQSGDHLIARLGFAAQPDGSCGPGKALFQVGYREGDAVNILQEWVKSCDRSLLKIDVNLSTLQGKTVQFILAVRAQGSPEGDTAVWNSPQIKH